MDIEKTREYYSNCTREECCSCAYCQNLIDEIRAAYPKVAEYFDSIGVDIERPFDASCAYEEENDILTYLYVDYLVVGDSSDFKGVTIDGHEIQILNSHPLATYKGEYFIIEMYNIKVKMRRDKYDYDGKASYNDRKPKKISLGMKCRLWLKALL